jgi:hypothetical protein
MLAETGQSAKSALKIAVARLRFFLLLGGVLLVVGAWPWLRNTWDRLTLPPAADMAISGDTEYWCPMCPGVVGDWPGKCPVCKMDLVRRKKGDMTPTTDGTLPRMQLSPYRVQLAGIHTSPVEYRRLEYEIVLGGLLEENSELPRYSTGLQFTCDIGQRDAATLAVDEEIKVTSERYPGQSFAARVASLERVNAGCVRARVNVENERELQPGLLVTASVLVPAVRFPEYRKHFAESWADETAVDLFVSTLGAPLASQGGLRSLFYGAVTQAAGQRDLLLAVPQSAVVDTGKHKVVFVERHPGLFDAVEVQLGRRCGDYFPVLSGVAAGELVVTAGAFLIDAESRLNPGAARDYFGATGQGAGKAITDSPVSPSQERARSPYGFSPEDQLLFEAQKICPVTQKPLDSMKSPFRMEVAGRLVFVCCRGCSRALESDPTKYLANLPLAKGTK